MSKIGINGFNRIARVLLRRCLRKKVPVVAINGVGLNADYVAYLLKYDSTYGRLNVEICGDKNSLKIDGKKVMVSAESDPKKICWKEANVDVVIESSGQLRTKELASKHLESGAKKVIIAGPSPDAPMFVCGVNLDKYTSDMTVISAASCTLNALAPLAKVIHENFCIEEGIMTDIHALTSNQNVLDTIGEDWRNCRGGLQNIIPSTSQAACTIYKIMPELIGKITGMSFTVPVPNVSVVDFTVRVQKPSNVDYMNEKIKEASCGSLQDILGYTDDHAVSSDFNGYSLSSVYDARACLSLNDKFYKVIIWYDNEYSFCCRILDLLKYTQKADEEDKLKQEQADKGCASKENSNGDKDKDKSKNCK